MQKRSIPLEGEPVLTGNCGSCRPQKQVAKIAESYLELIEESAAVVDDTHRFKLDLRCEGLMKRGPFRQPDYGIFRTVELVDVNGAVLSRAVFENCAH